MMHVSIVDFVHLIHWNYCSDDDDDDGDVDDGGGYIDDGDDVDVEIVVDVHYPNVSMMFHHFVVHLRRMMMNSN